MQKSIYTDGHEHFLALIRDVRLRAGLTQVQLAERLGTIQSRITDYERGIRRMDLMELHQYCEAIGLPLNEFVAQFEERLKLPPPPSSRSRKLGGSGTK